MITEMQAITLATKYNISEYTVKNIWAGRTWKYLKDKIKND